MASAAIMAGGSILSGVAGKKGAQKAAKIQAAAYQKGIDEQHRQFDTIQANNQPYMAAGTQGLDSLLTLLGIGGRDATGAISDLKASPTYTSMYDNGVDTILANASATGGLRGGNTNDSLARFGSDLLSQIYQQRIGNLGNLVGVGQSAASGTNGAALATGDRVSTLLGHQGSANTLGAVAPYAAFQQMINGLGQAFASQNTATYPTLNFGSSTVSSDPVSVMSGYKPHLF